MLYKRKKPSSFEYWLSLQRKRLCNNWYGVQLPSSSIFSIVRKARSIGVDTQHLEKCASLIVTFYSSSHNTLPCIFPYGADLPDAYFIRICVQPRYREYFSISFEKYCCTFVNIFSLYSILPILSYFCLPYSVSPYIVVQTNFCPIYLLHSTCRVTLTFYYRYNLSLCLLHVFCRLLEST